MTVQRIGSIVAYLVEDDRLSEGMVSVALAIGIAACARAGCGREAHSISSVQRKAVDDFLGDNTTRTSLFVVDRNLENQFVFNGAGAGPSQSVFGH